MPMRRSLSAWVTKSITVVLVILVGSLAPIGNGPALAVAGGAVLDHAPLKEGWRENPRVKDALNGPGEGCLTCHGDIENATVNMGFEIICTFCHGGDPVSTVKEIGSRPAFGAGHQRRDRRAAGLRLALPAVRESQQPAYAGTGHLRRLPLDRPTVSRRA